MAWTLKGTWYESCSCKMFCPCNLGPAEPDQGWCSGLLAFDVESGSSNGVDLAGMKLALHAQLPGDFFGGIDKARMYFDEASSDEQREQLEAIFQGKRGGVWEGVAGMIGEFLPSKTVQVDITGGDSPHVSVAGIADITMERLKTEDGQQAVVVNAPLSAGFAVDTLELAKASGKVSDPDLRQWETLGNGAAVPFDWSF
ncbi:MAG TPA: DUF1326 domain-containing protein [Acidimicrobiales bacterium]|nr:DUF1326 domain-containing protein [Acidimicrobiales bacterium]